MISFLLRYFKSFTNFWLSKSLVTQLPENLWNLKFFVCVVGHGNSYIGVVAHCMRLFQRFYVSYYLCTFFLLPSSLLLLCFQSSSNHFSCLCVLKSWWIRCKRISDKCWKIRNCATVKLWKVCNVLRRPFSWNILKTGKLFVVWLVS